MAEFKRGNWVRWDHGDPPCVHRHCLFLKSLGFGFGLIDQDGRNFTVALRQLTHDEAPS